MYRVTGLKWMGQYVNTEMFAVSVSSHKVKQYLQLENCKLCKSV